MSLYQPTICEVQNNFVKLRKVSHTFEQVTGLVLDPCQPSLSVACFHTLFAEYLSKSPENTESRDGMVVAQPTAIAFVPSKLGAWLTKGGRQMLWTIFVILLVLWLLGVVSSYTIGGFIHILLVLALVVLLINIIGGRRTVV
jgi:hypothetical protein